MQSSVRTAKRGYCEGKIKRLDHKGLSLSRIMHKAHRSLTQCTIDAVNGQQIHRRLTTGTTNRQHTRSRPDTQEL